MEAIDNENGLLALRGVVGREHLCGKTPSAAVHGSYFEMVQLPCFKFQVVLVVLNIGAIIEITLSYSCIYYVARRLGGRLLRVIDSIPLESHLVFILKSDTEVIRSQWCYDKGSSVLIVDISENGLIDRSCQGEAEVRILSVAHIGKILVR